ncbi:MAG: hypothetical protein Q8O64_19765 [Sideroxyarcus sp.]|nr:hypothetical protein [Sideroxyarcus sp.]
MIVLGVYLFSSGRATLNPFGSAVDKMTVKPLAKPSVRLADGSLLEPYSPAAPAPALAPAPVLAVSHPLSAVQLHITSRVRFAGGRSGYSFDVTQNGQRVFSLLQREVEEMGYAVSALSDCAARVSFADADYSQYVICDSPRVSVRPGQNIESAAGGTERAQERARTAPPAPPVEL